MLVFGLGLAVPTVIDITQNMAMSKDPRPLTVRRALPAGNQFVGEWVRLTDVQLDCTRRFVVHPGRGGWATEAVHATGADGAGPILVVDEFPMNGPSSLCPPEAGTRYYGFVGPADSSVLAGVSEARKGSSPYPHNTRMLDMREVAGLGASVSSLLFAFICIVSGAVYTVKEVMGWFAPRRRLRGWPVLVGPPEPPAGND